MLGIPGDVGGATVEVIGTDVDGGGENAEEGWAVTALSVKSVFKIFVLSARPAGGSEEVLPTTVMPSVVVISLVMSSSVMSPSVMASSLRLGKEADSVECSSSEGVMAELSSTQSRTPDSARSVVTSSPLTCTGSVGAALPWKPPSLDTLGLAMMTEPHPSDPGRWL